MCNQNQAETAGSKVGCSFGSDGEKCAPSWKTFQDAALSFLTPVLELPRSPLSRVWHSPAALLQQNGFLLTQSEILVEASCWFLAEFMTSLYSLLCCFPTCAGFPAGTHISNSNFTVAFLMAVATGSEVRCLSSCNLNSQISSNSSRTHKNHKIWSVWK